jgi:hypothetical protein
MQQQHNLQASKIYLLVFSKEAEKSASFFFEALNFSLVM